MQKILIVTKAFFPENSPRSFRATELAKELSRQGHSVNVLIPEEKIEHALFERENPNVQIKAFGPLKFRPVTPNGWKMKRLFQKIIQRGSALFLEYPDIEFIFRLPMVLNKENEYNLLISIAAPHPIHWGVSRALKKNPRLTKTWIADCGDPYMGVTLETFRKPFYFKFFEKAFCRRADYIAVPTEGAINAYYPEFRSKIKVIPQGFNLDNLKVFKGEINNHPIQFAYAGSIAGKGVRDPKPLLTYLSKKKHDFKFHVYSGSISLTVFNQFKADFKERIVIHEKKDRQELIYELSKMNFLVNFDNGTTRQTPSKLIDYALTGRPILNFYPLKPDFQQVDQFLSGNYSRKFIVNDVQKYNIVNVVAEFLKLSNLDKSI